MNLGIYGKLVHIFCKIINKTKTSGIFAQMKNMNLGIYMENWVHIFCKIINKTKTSGIFAKLKNMNLGIYMENWVHIFLQSNKYKNVWDQYLPN